MFPEPTVIVLIFFGLQAVTALIVVVILRKFYKTYKNNYFQYWYWSWLAMALFMLGSIIALVNVFVLDQHHPFRIIISTLNIAVGLTQFFWLFAGSYELSLAKKFNKRRFTIFTALVIPISLILVFSFINDPSLSAQRIFMRVGVKSLVGSMAFIASAILIYRLRYVGVGMKVIFFSFLVYGIKQLLYFISSLSAVVDFVSIGFSFPYYIGAFDLFVQSLMGLGMLLSMLEVESRNLSKANDELNMFIYRSSHDLRGPLTTISGIVNALKTREGKANQEEFLDAIQERVGQADNVIRDIITLRHGQMTELSIEELDIEAEIQKEYEVLSNLSENKVSLITEKNGNTRLRSDPMRVHTIFENILGNAIKYHDQENGDARIEVRLEEQEEGIHVKVSDNGPGISDKHLPKIFDMFYRANMSSLGTGLGLYLVKDSIDRLQGRIAVSSMKGKGTTFDIFLKNLD